MFKKFIVNKDYHNSRFDRWFKQNVSDVPQSLIEKFIRKNKVKINRKKTKTKYRVQLNDVVEVYGIENLKPITQSKTNKYKPSKKEKNESSQYHPGQLRAQKKMIRNIWPNHPSIILSLWFLTPDCPPLSLLSLFKSLREIAVPQRNPAE